METTVRPNPSFFALEAFHEESFEAVKEWKRKIIKKDTPADVRHTYVLALHEFVRVIEQMFEALGLELPDDIREATEI